ncbi:MAG: hypothetical protein GYB67_05895 [Chloroflexi bacterium]|nr:hypothetical protein [Chloroflexota bacterium]
MIDIAEGFVDGSRAEGLARQQAPDACARPADLLIDLFEQVAGCLQHVVGVFSPVEEAQRVAVGHFPKRHIALIAVRVAQRDHQLCDEQ